MATAAKVRKTRKCQSHLFDLNEDIFRLMFRYLNCTDVYFTIRRVCRKLKQYADNYIQLGGIFMLIVKKGAGTKILFVFEIQTFTSYSMRES